MTPTSDPDRQRALHVRWLGRVAYHEAHALQHGWFEHGLFERGSAEHGSSEDGGPAAGGDWLLLLEHPHVYTLGVRADLDHLLVDPASVGAELVRSDRGGDVTYHGPGQLVGYPILSLPGKGEAPSGGMADTVAYVRTVEQVVIDALADVGLPGAARLEGYPGVWVDVDGPDPRKIAAIGVRLTRGRTMHGFAVNVDPDLAMFGHIVPCGIADKGVTSLAAEGIDATMRDVVDAVAARAAAAWASGRPVDRAEVAWRHRVEDLSPFSRGEGPGAPAGSRVAAEAERRPGPHHAGDRGSDGVPEGDGGGAVPVTISARTAGAGAGVVAGASARAVAGVGTDADARAVAGAAADDQARARAGADGTTARRRSRLAEAGVVQGLHVGERKPEWLRAKVRIGTEHLRLQRLLRDFDLVTVCEEAGCPNLSECWADGTATFMINGERCTRACGFCLVDTSRPEPLAVDEPERVAEAVAAMGLAFAVVTAVARDDLPDGGAAAFAATIEAVRRRSPGTQVEVLIPDCKGDPSALDVLFAARPDVVNHNLETVARLQRAVRPSAGYARSLAVLARAKAAELTTKSGLVVGLGETDDEVAGALADLAGVGVDIVTIGQYLRPTSHHLPVARWVEPARFEAYAALGRSLGIGHVEASPLTRSSYHARQAATAGSAVSP